MFPHTQQPPSFNAFVQTVRMSPSDPLVLEIKQQLAIVRTLADELERCLVGGSVMRALRDQLAQELTRLARQSLATAVVMAGKADGASEQGSIRLWPGAAQ